MDGLILIIIGALLGGFFADLFTHGKWRKLLAPVCIVIIILSLAIKLPSIFGYRWIFPLERITILGVSDDSHQNASDPKTLEKHEISSCPTGSYCSDFQDKDWEGWEYFYKRQIDKVVLIPQISGVQDNPSLWFLNKQSNPNFELILKVAPQKDDKGNIVIKYGDWWRCIVAESNYNTFACEGQNRKLERWFKTLSSIGKKPIQPKTELSVHLISEITTTNHISLTLLVNYIDIASNPDSATFSYTLPIYSPDPLKTEKPVGVGIIDSNKEGVGVEFGHFELKPKQL